MFTNLKRFHQTDDWRRNGHNLTVACLGLVTALVFLQLSTTVEGFDTYFPMSDIQITLPLHPDAELLLEKRPLLTLSANRLRPLRIDPMQKDATIDDDEFEYDVYKTYGLLNISAKSGHISMTASQIRQLDDHVTTFIVEATAASKSSRSTSWSSAKMTLSMRAQQTSSLAHYCQNVTNLCFWESVSYKIAENSVAWNQSVGDLGPDMHTYLCPDYFVKYVLLNGTTYFSIRNNRLYTNTRIDHDTKAPGPQMAARVQCQVTQRHNSVIQLRERILHFTVLDRNDNLPELHTPANNISVTLDNPYFHNNSEVGRDLLFSDGDSLTQNSNTVFEIVNDPLDVLRSDCRAFEVNMSGLKSSAYNCKLYFKRSGVLQQSPYCVLVLASDPTVDIVRPSAQRVSPHATVCLLVDVNKIHEIDRPAAQALKADSGLENASRKRNRKNRKLTGVPGDGPMSDGPNKAEMNPSVVYPHEISVRRSATPMFRLVQPYNMTDLINRKSLAFRISKDTTGAFGITPVAGIVFVANVTALHRAQAVVHSLTIVWPESSATIVVRLENSSSSVKENNMSQNKWLPCSETGFKSECLQTNGWGTDGTGCQWRPNNLTFPTQKYATCSPNLITCPDNVCDPLEAMAHETENFTCPQDCVTQSNVFGPHSINTVTKIGIQAAVGVCTCDEFGKCSCGVHAVAQKPVKHKKIKTTDVESTTAEVMVQSVPAKATTMREQCGATCIMLLVLCPLALICVAGIVVVSRRKKFKHTHKKSPSKHTSMVDLDQHRDVETLALTEMPDAYHQISATYAETIHPTAELTFPSDADTKWEFDRNRLILDTVLGEGEFGRVVKGFATDIDGNDDGVVTTVAVKMLKTGANSVELLALLSEFQLLQEVTHPNVIRLLGACTVGLPMVIIEYAKHGSLRNYLRLSRKLECSGIEFCDGVEPVTARDILSFAWQICKGMAYLTEIKLVHRDLAARNVLLTEGKICKISDFGLTRDVYEDDAYLKRSKDRVPVKWMAPESLADHVYTCRSDVWAFGILSWELITLGASPYPGIPPQNLYHLLKTGYRMERPVHCSEEVYTIIQSCWMDDPHIRPPFKWLASQWEGLLGNNAKYINMENNAVSNPLYCVNNTNDRSADQQPATTLQQELGEPDKVDHLWHAPKLVDYGTTSPDQTDSSANVPLGYDIPKPLIDSRTDEQNLRYQNELRTDQCLPNGPPKLVDLSHYDTPARRRKSYLDMTGVGRTPSIGYNLDNQNAEKTQRLSKDISFRFSSLLNLSEHFTSPPI